MADTAANGGAKHQKHAQKVHVYGGMMTTTLRREGSLSLPLHHETRWGWAELRSLSATKAIGEAASFWLPFHTSIKGNSKMKRADDALGVQGNWRVPERSRRVTARLGKGDTACMEAIRRNVLSERRDKVALSYADTVRLALRVAASATPSAAGE